MTAHFAAIAEVCGALAAARAIAPQEQVYVAA